MDSPDSPYFAKYRELLPLELDELIGNQGKMVPGSPIELVPVRRGMAAGQGGMEGRSDMECTSDARNFERIEGV